MRPVRGKGRGFRLLKSQELFDGKADILCDLPEQEGRYVAAGMKRHSRAPAIGMPILFVGTSLAYFDEAGIAQDCRYLTWLQNWRCCHDSQTRTLCVPTNSASNSGSPSSSSISMTSRRLEFNSSREDACECAPGKPGTYPTNSPVSGSRSTTAVNYLGIADSLLAPRATR